MDPKFASPSITSFMQIRPLPDSTTTKSSARYEVIFHGSTDRRAGSLENGYNNFLSLECSKLSTKSRKIKSIFMVAFLSFSFYPSQTETLRTCDSPSTSLFFRSLQLIFIDRPILPSAGHKLKPIGVFHFRTRTNSVSLPLRCWRKSPVTLPPCGDKPTHRC